VNGRRARARRAEAEAEDLASRVKNTLVFLPSEMSIGALVDLVHGGILFGLIRTALDQLQPYERRTSQITSVKVTEVSRSDNGAVEYEIQIEHEHDCPNGVCDDCIGNDQP
jgi:hypothetical protein